MINVRQAWTALLLLSVITWPMSATARDLTRQVQFDIAPQPLSAAVIQFSKQAEVQVLASGQKLNGVSTQGVRGRHSIDEGLRILLGETGFRSRVSANNVILLTPVDTSDPPAPSGEKGGQAANPTVLAQAQSAERPGQPQASPSREKAVQLEGIVVTAQKREERLIDVPLSVAVVTAEDIDRRRFVSAEDYLRGIPGVNQGGQGGLGTAIQIRGIETAPSPYFQNFTSGPSVATYFGETPTTNSAGFAGGSNIDLKVVDVERVEVLRGPQGTAFGSSAMGGVVRTMPQSPRFDRFEGKVAASYSSTADTGGDNYMSQAVINLPLLQDRLAVRAVAYGYEDSGYYRNIARSDPVFLTGVTAQGAGAFAVDQENVGSVSVAGGRLAANFRATNNTRVLFTYLTQRSQVDGQANSTRGNYQQAVLQVAPEHVVRGRPEGVFDTDLDLLSATMDIELRPGTFIATYSRVQTDAQYSSPRTAVVGTQPYSQLGTSNHRGDSGEVRFTSRLDGPWNFLVGVYGERLKDHGSFNFVWYGSLAAMPPTFGRERFLGEQRDTRALKQNAAFGEASWEFLRNVTLTGGARYYDYRRTGRIDNEGAFLGGTSSTDTSVAATGSTFRTNLSYKPNDNSIAYASWSQGFRLGKPQAPLPSGVCDTNGNGILDGTDLPISHTGRVNSDEVDSYELGGRVSALQRRLFFSGAVYRVDWSGIPFRVGAPARPTGCGLVYITNAGRARSEGIEAQVGFSFTRELRVDIGGSITNAKLIEEVPAQRIPAGTRLPGTPKYNANAGVQYEFMVAGHRGFARADAIYLSDFHVNLPATPANRLPAYVKFDISARLAVDGFNVDLFVQNLTNEGNESQDYLYSYRLRPRTIGFQVGYAF